MLNKIEEDKKVFFVLNFKYDYNRVIASVISSLNRMEEILLTRYGVLDGQKLSSFKKKFIDFLRDSEFHSIDSYLNIFFNKVKRYGMNNDNLDRLFNRYYINNDNLDELFKRYESIISRIGTLDKNIAKTFRDNYKIDSAFVHYKEGLDYREPSELELKIIERNEKIEKRI